MPDAQEGLLDGMVTASQLMHRIVDLNREANNLNSRRIAHVEPAERTKKKLNGCTLGCTTSILFVLLWPVFFAGVGLDTMVQPLLLWMFLIAGIWLYRSRKTSRENANARTLALQQNAVADQKNAEIDVAIQSIREQLVPLQQRWAEEIAPWYPMDYDRLDAVDFFVVALRNQRAQTIGELVNLYETEGHRRRMEAGQQEMIGQQRIGNMLQLGNLVMQGAQIGAMRQANSKLSEINANAAATASSAARSADVASRMARKWNL